MKKTLNLLNFFFAFFLFSVNSLAGAANISKEVLDLPITLTSGKVVTLASYAKSKPVYLKFWASWCQTCLKELPHFEKTYQSYGKEKIEVIGVNMGINDDIASIDAIVRKNHLSMPMAIDKTGDLVQAFGVIGTPYHVLLDKNSNVVFKGFTDDSLDGKIHQLASGEAPNLLETEVATRNNPALDIKLNDGSTHALFFTATWCDWYFLEKYPDMSKNCVNAQNQINSFTKNKGNAIKLQGYVSRLWTETKDVEEYKKKYAVQNVTTLDETNEAFHRFKIDKIPTLLIVKNDKIVSRVTDFSDSSAVANAVKN